MISEINALKSALIGPLVYWGIPTLAALALFSAPLIVTGDPLPADTFYVAPGGDDNNPGTLEFPLQSLEAARQKVRDHKATFGLGIGGIAVILREGTWTRTESLVLSSQDGGEPGRPIVWRAFPGETVRVLGGATIQADWFEPVSDAHPEWTRLPVEARGNVLRTRLSDHGLTDYGQLKVRGFGYRMTGALELFADEEPMPLARWPDPDQHDVQPSHQDFQLTLYGSTQPDVSGGWTQSGTRDGVNAYTRDDPVNGIPYYLYRNTWVYLGEWYTAWFIAAQDNGYPGNQPPGNQHPWWVFYGQDLGIFNPQNGAYGQPRAENLAAIKWGFAVTENRLSDSSFTVATDRLSRWTTAEDPWFHGYWWAHWADNHVNSSSIDPKTRTITLAESPYFGLAAGMPFYALNLLEEITRPGEWYLDRSTGFLYWWPKGVVGGQEIMVSMLEEPLLRVQNAEHLQFVDISFGMGRQDLATVEGGTDVAFERCRFFGAGNDGLHLTGGNHRLEHSEVVDTGDRGVVLDGGERKSLSPGNNLVENSEIHRFARWSSTYMPGIDIFGVGHRVAHNHVHDSPYIAIWFEGNEHLIEYNEINNVVRFSDDTGAIYAGRHWGWHGNRIEYNYIHHIDSPFLGLGVHGVYLDDALSGTSVFGNLFVEVSGYAMMHGGGRDNLFENNIVVRSGRALSSDSRGVVWITDIPGNDWNLLERLRDEGVEYQQEPWCSTYPELCAIPDSWEEISAPSSLWKYPEGSVFSRNLGWQNIRFTREDNWPVPGTFDKFAEIQDNLENTDPRFVNEAAGDYRLAADSPALSIPGFVDIPFQQMGIVGPSPGDDVAGLTLINQVITDNGGTAVPADWTVSATGGPTPFSGPGPGVSSDANFQAGSYALSARGGWSGYTASAWACDGGSLNGATITLTLGESATCSITHNDKAPSLSLDKIVVNNNGGTARESDWTLFANDGPTPISGPGAAGSTDVQSNATFQAGTYNLSESTGPAGYTASSWICASGNLNGSALTIALGETATCTITSDDTDSDEMIFGGGFESN